MIIKEPGMIFNVFICELIFAVGLFVAFSIWQKNKGNKSAAVYAGFWFLFSFIWFFTGLRQFFAQLGFENLDRSFFIADQFFVFGHIVLGGYYIYLRLFKKEKIALIFSLLFLAMGATAIYGIFKYGVALSAVTYFATKWILNEFSWLVFNVIFALFIGAVSIHCLKYILSWLKNRKITDFYPFLASFAVLLYASVGYFDEKGLIAGWPLLFFRLLYILALLLAYLSFTSQNGLTEKISGNNEK